MPDCPFCNDPFLTDEDRANHIAVAHPEKTISAEAIAKAGEKQAIYHVASTLTLAAIQIEAANRYIIMNAAPPREHVSELFWHFVGELKKGR